MCEFEMAKGMKLNEDIITILEEGPSVGSTIGRYISYLWSSKKP